MQDHRQAKRWQINWQAKIKLEGAVAFINCSISNLSFKGCRVALAPKLPTDTFLKLSLILGKDCVLQDIEAWVAWHRRIENLNLYGFYFSRIKDTDKEKIYKFMREYFPELLYSQWREEATKADKGMQDHRIFERVKAQLPLKFLNLNENEEGRAVTEDISAKGVGFATDTAIKPGTPLEMWLQVHDKGEPLYIRGEVVWSRLQAANKYRVGINLEKANLMGLSRALSSC